MLVEIANVGPIETLSIPIPEGGGVVVLRGRNGAGKSQAIVATEALVSGRGSLDCRQGASKGSVDGFGAKITVGRTTRRSGPDELEVQTLEGKLSIADLVQPPIKSEDAADAARIKALVGLVRGQFSPADISEAIGPDILAEHVSQSSLEGTDPVVMAARIKRDLDAAARKEEDAAAKADANAAACRAGVDTEEAKRPIPEQRELQAAIEKAVKVESELNSRRKAAQEAKKQAASAAQQITAIGDDWREDLEKCQRAVEDSAIKLAGRIQGTKPQSYITTIHDPAPPKRTWWVGIQYDSFHKCYATTFLGANKEQLWESYLKGSLVAIKQITEGDGLENVE